MSQASDANEKTASSVVAGKSLVGSSASPQAQPQGTPAAAISLKDASLAAAWDVAAEAIEQDLMRPVRYGMCIRYLIPNLKWRPQSFWRSLPLVLCSDENVFFLRKKA
jgi:hypothetical protein